jgi:hypothetical protein
MSSRRAAPPGKHLLSLVMARFFLGGTSAGEPWSAARARVDEAVDYLRRFYADLDACVEWSRLPVRDGAADDELGVGARPPARLTVDGLDGLYLAGSTIEAPAGIVDLGHGRDARPRAPCWPESP